MNIRILKPIKEKPKYKPQSIIKVTNEYGKDLIKRGLAEPSDQMSNDEVMMREANKEIESNKVEKVEVTHKIEEQPDPSESNNKPSKK